MDNSHLLRAPGLASASKLKQMTEAKTMMKVVRERAERMNVDPPPYNLLELIGKGSYGRVFKSQQHGKRGLVAVKIMDIDSSDYNVDLRAKDDAIKDYTREISILHALKQGNAKNINIIYDAFGFHSQLWIVSEYCPGGSVHTLMKASPKPGLEEKYIVTICRELAVAMKCVHDAGIIHRDVKAANILITQDGQLQLCDFGVSGILENSVAKRTTIIGTPQWMAPEMHAQYGVDVGYGTEIDCWAFGCTVYELATGQPPNARIHPDHIHKFLQTAPKLLGEEFSPGLREFVAFCLNVRPADRPNAEAILKHPFIFNTSKKNPTVMLKELITRYTNWEQQGGQRASLFMAHGAAAPTMLAPAENNEDDDWNFSTSDDADSEYSNQYNSPPRIDHRKADSSNETTPRQHYGGPIRDSSIRDNPFVKANEEVKAVRGGLKMEAIFNENLAPYAYSNEQPEEMHMSDLPLRNMSVGDATRESVIDLDAAFDTDVPTLDLPNLQTVKAVKNRFYDDDDDDYLEPPQSDLPKYVPPSQFVSPQPRDPQDLSVPMARSATEGQRPKTQEWSFSQAQAEFRGPMLGAQVVTNAAPQPSLAPPFRPTLKHTVTEPLGNFGDYLHPAVSLSDLAVEPSDRASIIDIDQLYLSQERPSTASSAGNSVVTDFTSDNPFYMDEGEGEAVPFAISGRHRDVRSSFHLHSQSEPDRGPAFATGHNHYKGQSSFSSDSEWEHRPRQQRISVQASVDSLRQKMAADANDEANMGDYLQMRQISPTGRSMKQLQPNPAQMLAASKLPAFDASVMMKPSSKPSSIAGSAHSRNQSTAHSSSASSDINKTSPPRRVRTPYNREQMFDSEQGFHHPASSLQHGHAHHDRTNTTSTNSSYPQAPSGSSFSSSIKSNNTSGTHTAGDSFSGGTISHSPAKSSFSSIESSRYPAYSNNAPAPGHSVSAGSVLAAAAAFEQQAQASQQTTPVPAHRRHQIERANSSIASIGYDRDVPPMSASSDSFRMLDTPTAVLLNDGVGMAGMGMRMPESRSDTNSTIKLREPANYAPAGTSMFPAPPAVAALVDGADLDVVVGETGRLLGHLLMSMRTMRGLLGARAIEIR